VAVCGRTVNSGLSEEGERMTDTEHELLKAFPRSFINEFGEFIAHDKANEYFILKNCANDLDIKCKVLEWLSRGASKTAPFRTNKKNEEFNNFMLSGINEFLCTEFTREDMRDIYSTLGNCVNHEKTIEFIESGYDFVTLSKNRAERGRE